MISLANPQVDPFLELVDDVRLQAVNIESDNVIYGSQEDDFAAMKSLSALELDDRQLKETVLSCFLTKFSKLSEVIHIISLLLGFMIGTWLGSGWNAMK